MRRARGLLSQSLHDAQRPRLFALVAAGLLALTLALTLLAPAAKQPSPEPRGTSTAPTTPVPPVPARATAQAGVTVAARAFLRDYLAFLHGQRHRPAFAYATGELARRLGSYELRVSPAARERRPVVLRTTVRRIGSSRWLVRATVSDGDLAAYPIELTVALRDARPVVTALGEE